MFSKTIKLKHQIIEVNIFDTPFINENNYIFFGHPLGDLNSEDYNNIKGSWLKIIIKKDALVIVTDIIGTYRLYYLKTENHLHISDDYGFLLNKIANVEIDKIEYDYWRKHDYTTGGKTLFKGLYKFKPATENTIKEGVFKESLYFKNLPLYPNSQIHTKHIFEDLDNTFSLIKKLNKKVILMFSGGKDSCLLALFLKRHNIEFTPVFLKLEPTFNQAFLDFQKVKQISKIINIETDIINVKVDSFSKEDSDKIHQVQLLDKHFTPVHFKGVQEIKKTYGQDILIVNGSTSDSILTFGPSEKNKVDFLRRHMMFNPSSMMAKIGVKLLNFKTKRKFRLGKTNDEVLLALMDEYKYCRVLDTEKDESYYNYLLQELSFSRTSLTTFSSLEMYAKNFTFLQGTTQQVIHNSCKYHNIRYVMPFGTPEIIYSTLQYRDIKLEIKNPKYSVENILKEKFNLNYNAVKLNYNKQTFSYNLDELRAKVNEEFENCLTKITNKKANKP